VIGEAMVAWVLADALLQKLGGDSLDEQLPRFAALPATGWTTRRWTLATKPDMSREPGCAGFSRSERVLIAAARAGDAGTGVGQHETRRVCGNPSRLCA
jgi:hypothetical protein